MARPPARPPRSAPAPPPTRPWRPGRLAELEPEALRPARKGRGARANPSGRFEARRTLPDADAVEARVAQLRSESGEGPLGPPGPEHPDPSATGATAEADRSTTGAETEAARSTTTIRDASRRAIVFNQSPDIPFDASLNPYRGCEHGCAYCYARPTHEYLGLSAGLDFESKILVKEDAPELLRRELSSPRWVPQVVAISGVTDAYQPLERRLRITRRCLEVLAEVRNPVAVITKSALVTRDVDLLQALAAHDAVSVSVSITTLDPALQRAMEPRASSPRERLRAIERLSAAGIPTGVMVAPIVPGLTDHETPRILEAAAAAGASHAGHIVLRLPHGLKDLFDDWLRVHRPLRRTKVLHRLESLRGGRLNDPRFGSRMRGEGRFAEQIGGVFRLWARRHGLDHPHPTLSTAAFRRPGGTQLSLALGPAG